jgi:GrpB-like predicted nucleotidyltransferase (UPF0157 family)
LYSVVMPQDTNDRTIVEHENRPYDFGSYDHDWPIKFSKISDEIKRILGDEIIAVEHIGSTSIPGMPSKPQLDVLVTVKNLNAIPSYYDQMQEHGYVARGDFTKEGEEYFTKDNANGKREVSVHVLPDGHRWVIELVAFRDYLRSNPTEMQLYAFTKEEMHKKFPDNYTEYYKGKLAVVLELLDRDIKWHKAKTD